MGFWEKGKQKGFGKFMSKNKKKFGCWFDDGKIDWLKNEFDAWKFIRDNNLERYKNFFKYSLDDIINFFVNDDIANKILNIEIE